MYVHVCTYVYIYKYVYIYILKISAVSILPQLWQPAAMPPPPQRMGFNSRMHHGGSSNHAEATKIYMCIYIYLYMLCTYIYLGGCCVVAAASMMHTAVEAFVEEVGAQGRAPELRQYGNS